jgi:hypothetical protein
MRIVTRQLNEQVENFCKQVGTVNGDVAIIKINDGYSLYISQRFLLEANNFYIYPDTAVEVALLKQQEFYYNESLGYDDVRIFDTIEELKDEIDRVRDAIERMHTTKSRSSCRSSSRSDESDNDEVESENNIYETPTEYSSNINEIRWLQEELGFRFDDLNLKIDQIIDMLNLLCKK